MINFLLIMTAAIRILSRPILGHNSKPNLRRGLVYLVHHRSRSSSHHCPIPPSAPNQPWIQSLAQTEISNTSRNWDRALRSNQWESSKSVHYQWIRSVNQKALIDNRFHVSSVKRPSSRHSIRIDHWKYAARDVAQKQSLFRGSLLRSLDIMSKPCIRQSIQPSPPPQVKASTPPKTLGPKAESQSRPAAIDSFVKMNSISRDLALNHRGFERSSTMKPASLASLEKCQQEQPLDGALLEPTASTPKIKSNDMLDEPPEPQKNTIQPTPRETTHLASSPPVVGSGTGHIFRSHTKAQFDAPDRIAIDHPESQEREGSVAQAPLQAITEESATQVNHSGNTSKLSPADLIASLRYYDRRRGALPDEEPLSAQDIAALESSRVKLTESRKLISQERHFDSSSQNSTWRAKPRKIGLAVSSVVIGGYIFGVGNKLLSVQPESTAGAELLSAVQRSRSRTS